MSEIIRVQPKKNIYINTPKGKVLLLSRDKTYDSVLKTYCDIPCSYRIIDERGILTDFKVFSLFMTIRELRNSKIDSLLNNI